ncbi:MAG TPA: bifunctional UDP-sugar hydrolase/5'-nucleotidase [Planctomycetota bacterium]|nr:bifunctional UDP-sugar hydrolase/5'-nucleotidase [Planctomycetota bacterium]
MRSPLRIPAAPALLALALLASSCAAGPREDTVLLLHTNDIHGHIEMLPTLSGLARAERERRRDVLWLDAGDAISGTPVSSEFQGTPIFSVTSLAGIDAACLGNHEFDHGWERIALFREAATYPILCANARSPEGALLADAEWQVFPVDGVRVGVIGILSERTPNWTVKKGNEGLRFEAAVDALKRLIPEVRPKCDVLVALTHLGYDDDREIARAFPALDVIVGGHSHTDLPGPVELGGVIVVQAFKNGQRLGRLELTVDLEKGRVARWVGKPVVVEPEKQPRDAAVARLVAELEAKVSAKVDRPLGEAKRRLSQDDVGRLAEQAFREALGTDIGYMNPGGVRAAFAEGPITVRKVWEAFPFDNTLVTVRIRGKRMEAGLAARLPGPVDPDRVYTVATNSFVAERLDREIPGAEPGVEDSGIVMRDAVVEWIRKHPALK